MRDPGSGGGISCRCLIFLRDREARQSNLGNFLQPCKAQLCPACPPEKRLAVPSSARPGAFAGAGPGKSGDSNWTGLGQGVLAHFIHDSRGRLVGSRWDAGAAPAFCRNLHDPLLEWFEGQREAD